ncbi:MAG: hypothetical protein P8X82_15625, partial [Gemmatimonadales bacterium]
MGYWKAEPFGRIQPLTVGGISGRLQRDESGPVTHLAAYMELPREMLPVYRPYPEATVTLGTQYGFVRDRQHLTNSATLRVREGDGGVEFPSHYLPLQP